MYYEDLEPGMTHRGMVITITEAHIVSFGHLTMDLNPLHMDRHFCARFDFGRRIAHGMLVSSLALGSVTHFLRGDSPEGIATHLEDSYTYRDPVFVGDTVTTEAEVLDKEPHSRFGVVRIGLLTRKQEEILVMRGWVKLGFHYLRNRSEILARLKTA